MQQIDLEQFKELCQSTQHMLMAPHQNLNLLSRIKQVWQTKKFNSSNKTELDTLTTKLANLSNSVSLSDDLHQRQNQLIFLLDDARAQLSTDASNQLLRETVQDALRETIRQSMHIDKRSHDRAEEKKLDNEQHQKADPFYTRGDFMISGLLVEWFGVREILLRALLKIKFELNLLQEKNIEEGFLNFTTLKNYLNDIQDNINAINTEDFDEEASLQHVRYLIDNIQQAAGVLPPDKAKYDVHQDLIHALFWHDEILKLAQSKLALEKQL